MSCPKFASFEEMVETLERGNEINFSCRGRQYFLLPHWNGTDVEGYAIGMVYSNDEMICKTREELAKHPICGTSFIDLFDEISIDYRTI